MLVFYVYLSVQEHKTDFLHLLTVCMHKLSNILN